MNDPLTDKLRIFGNYQIYFNHSHWEVRGRHDKLVVGQCHTQDEAVEKALGKVRRARASCRAWILSGFSTVEHLMLRRLSPDNLQQAVYEIHGALSNYPVYNDSAYSEVEHEATQEYWDKMCTDRRIELCGEYGASIFASRHDRIPEPLYEQVRAWATE